MTVDHIIPEYLSEHPEKLRRLRQDYEIDVNHPGFQINDFTNWVPAHPHKCNARKGSMIFPKRMTLLLLQEVQRHLGRVQREVEMLYRTRTQARHLGLLGVAIEKRQLSVKDVREFIEKVEREQHADEPLVLTFSLTVEELLESNSLPDGVPHEYPYLCDWLELDLVKYLRSIITTPFHYTQPSERWGDGLSVRMVFPDLNATQFENFDLPWWNILEATSFWEVFGERYVEAFPDPPKKEYFGELEPT